MNQNENHPENSKALMVLHKALGEAHDFHPPGVLADYVREGPLNQVLTLEIDDTMELAVELQADLLKMMAELKLPDHFSMKDWPSIAVAAEELSHFHALIYKALHDQEVSRLELEVQGEVDKLALALQWLEVRNEDFLRETVFDNLFRQCQLADHVAVSDRVLYQEAHDIARSVGRRMMALESPQRQKMLSDFFRLSAREKFTSRF